MTSFPTTSWPRQESQAWALLQAARALADTFAASHKYPESSFRFNAATGQARTEPGNVPGADLRYCDGGWHVGTHLPGPVREMLGLYLPVLGRHDQPAVVIGHLGQSIDARIATLEGDACFVTGEENRKHLHRLRSLCHAVLVGAGTVVVDDPQLTTRAVTGANPVRVVLDPQARIAMPLTMLGDGEAPVWLLHDAALDIDSLPVMSGVRRLCVAAEGGVLQPADVLAVLAGEGLQRIFVEGGGVTVSRFFNAGCLDRLQVAVAPLLVGQGIPALQLPAAESMREALRPGYTVYRMGEDVLWDFALRADPGSAGPAAGPPLQRLF